MTTSKWITASLLAASCLLLPAMAAAQDGATSSASALPKVGLGVEIDQLFQDNQRYQLYIPINISPQLRIEPIFGFQRSSTTTTNTNDNDVTVTNYDATTAFSLGVGGFYMWSLADSINVYAGGRIQFVRGSTTSEDTIEIPNQPTNTTTLTISQSGVDLGGAIGSEWYFTRFMSFGGEGQLNLNWRGTPTIERTGNPNNDGDSRSSTTINPNVELFMRFYFM